MLTISNPLIAGRVLGLSGRVRRASQDHAGRVASRRVITRRDLVFVLEARGELTRGRAEIGLECDLRRPLRDERMCRLWAASQARAAL